MGTPFFVFLGIYLLAIQPAYIFWELENHRVRNSGTPSSKACRDLGTNDESLGVWFIQLQHKDYCEMMCIFQFPSMGHYSCSFWLEYYWGSVGLRRLGHTLSLAFYCLPLVSAFSAQCRHGSEDFPPPREVIKAKNML